MKKIVLFLLFFSYSSLFSFTLVLNSAKENGKYYEILHLRNSKSFSCLKKVIDLSDYEYICKIDNNTKIDIKPKFGKFVNIFFNSSKNQTTITIKPKFKANVYKNSFELYKNKEIGEYRLKSSKHWIFIFYKDSIFLKSESKDRGIDFPIIFTKKSDPYIGALDPGGNPIEYLGNNKDITAYLSIKDDFDKQRYAFVISEVDRAIKNYPNSIFMNDFLLYKIRSIYKLLKTKENSASAEDASYEEIVKLGKKWIKQFSSDRNIPEVLYYIATAFQNLGQDSDAKYFYDILITEHSDSKYAKLSIISFADSLRDEDKINKAIKLYNEVLYSTKDIEVASLAADRLANVYLKQKKLNQAKRYFKKIIDANSRYYLKDPQKAYLLALKLSKNSMEHLSIELLQKLLLKVRKNSDLKENIIKSIADVYAKIKDKKMAAKYYKMYLKEFRYGQYADQVKRALDALFYNSEEKNSTKLLKHYDKLMKDYKGSEIYQKAAVLKAKLLIKLKRYDEALKFLNSFQYSEKNKKIVRKLKKLSATQMVKEALLRGDCIGSVKMIREYKVSVDKALHKKLASCYLQTEDFKNALDLAKENLKNKKLSVQDRFYWMMIEVKSLFEQKRYEKVNQLCDDIISIGKIYNIKGYKKALYYKFFSLYELREFDKALRVALKIEKSLPDSFKNCEVFYKLVKYGKSIDDSTIVIKYSKEIIRLQKRYQSFPYSPEIELMLINTLKKIKSYDKAISICKDILKRVKTKKIRARILYELGDIYLKKGKKRSALKAFKDCSKLSVKSGWSDLCKESLKIF